MEKGDKVFIDLNKNVTWDVFKNGTKINSGEGSRVDFKISDYGYWEIKSEGKTILAKDILKTSVWWNPLTWDVVKKIGNVGLVIVILGILFLGYFIFFKNGVNNKSLTPYS